MTIALILAFAGLSLNVSAQEGRETRSCSIVDSSTIFLDPEKRGAEKYSIVKGGNLVFEVTSKLFGNEGNHSEVETIWVFEVPLGSDSFLLVDHQISDHGGIYIQKCRCADRGIQHINLGRISGNRGMNGSWNISMDAIAIGSLTGIAYRLEEKSNFTAVSR